MTPKPLAFLPALALAAAALPGCNSTLDTTQARTAAPFEPTALFIVDETRPLTVEELAAQRPAIVGYLVRRGYLESPGALVDNPALASRIIRVILSPSGSFRISEFTLGNRARHIVTTRIIPGHSDGYDYSYGYYLTARPYPEPPAYSPAPSAPPGGYQPTPPADRPPRVHRPDERPRRHERRIHPEGRGAERSPRADTRSDNGGSPPSTSPPPPDHAPPPEPRPSSGESRNGERKRPHDP